MAGHHSLRPQVGSKDHSVSLCDDIGRIALDQGDEWDRRLPVGKEGVPGGSPSGCSADARPAARHDSVRGDRSMLRQTQPGIQSTLDVSGLVTSIMHHDANF
jgi:hypothetical protein